MQKLRASLHSHCEMLVFGGVAEGELAVVEGDAPFLLKIIDYHPVGEAVRGEKFDGEGN